MVYLDEAGISNPTHEPYVVVAGVVLRANSSWKRLETHLSEMADRYLGPDRPADFCFHATELYSGGKLFPRDKYSKEDRWRILDELVRLPVMYDMPVVHGSVERARLAARFPDQDIKTLTKNAILISFATCSFVIEDCMRRTTGADDVAVVVMESNNQMNARIRSMHEFSRDPRNVDLLRSEKLGDFALTKVVDTIHFSEKGQSSPLQVADAVAFAIKRRLMRAGDYTRFYKPLMGMMSALPKDDLPAGSPTYRRS